jgi:hypothetical protein
MTGPLTPSVPPKLKFFIPGTTNVASGAKLFTYAAGTTTKQATYSTSTGTPNTNPIILDANGECVCYLDSNLEYDFWFCPSTDTDPPTNPYWTVGSVGFGNMINGLAPLNSPAFTGTPTAPTATVGDSSTDIANTQFVQTAITNAFSNNPTVPTPSAGDYSTKIATTAFVGNEINKAGQMVVFANSGTWNVPTNVKWAKFRIWGPGGGGGGGSAGNVGSGGGGGGYAEGWISLGSNTSLAIVIGTPGSGGAAGNAGTAGTASTVAALGITANGGGGGAGNGGTPGAGGSASGLTFTWNGGGGGTTVNQSAGIDAAGGGSWGTVGVGIIDAFGPGCGGAGKYNSTGGNAGPGLCIIEWLAP